MTAGIRQWENWRTEYAGGHLPELVTILNSADTQPWMRDGLCAQADPERWFPDAGGDNTKAKSVCYWCPVRQQCAEYAIARPELTGIWGGTSERDRQRIRSERGAA